jgi:hypothetical protein
MDMTGKRTKLFIFSDNKLIDAGHSAFINAGNREAVKRVAGNQTAVNDATRGGVLAGRDPDDRCHGRLTKWMEVLDTEPIHKPYICQEWTTWEAQRGKTELDMHFAYINTQLTEASLIGGIDYLEPRSVSEALSYSGGCKATTALLLEEDVSASSLPQFSRKRSKGLAVRTTLDFPRI